MFLPSRLVKITAINGTINSACLFLRDELPTKTRYLTLSYCWGSQRIASLESAMFKEYRTNIPLSSLSKTFKEAFQVTVWLGYQYIWIDSLCIQQDSKSDWETEAATMGMVYGISTCTIAATGARNGDAGLFFDRSSISLMKCPLLKLPGQ